MARFRALPIYITLLILAAATGCRDSAESANAASSFPPDEPVRQCTVERFRFMEDFRLINIRSADPAVRAAVEGAAKAVDQSAARFVDQYCALENTGLPGPNRCFHFLLAEPTPGGDIGLCVATDHGVSRVFLGQ